ncbi:hypothetical protein FHS42_003660 [Streptomyces zagrosensis]|uniref:Uncharacterized protein n=1 Tax=Streptomyces zagrosensis TaxID=1042984 RepID=A0A7W9UZ25_9ACTN|nr:hypothetical protein [Streptomyces zagrosensis]
MAAPVRVRRLTDQEWAAVAATTPTTPTTRCRHEPCTPIYAGATPTPATVMSWPPNAKKRARIRSEKGIRWGGRPLNTAA